MEGGIQSYCNILSKTVSLQWKYLGHTKKQETVTHTQEKSKQEKNVCEGVQILELVEKVAIRAIIEL